MLEPAKPYAAPARRARALKGRKQFSLLIVRGDGVRVVRFNVPRPAVLVAVVALGVSVSALGALLGDWVELRRLTHEARGFQARIAEQRGVIDEFNRRVAQLRQEAASWQELQARIWDPLGPELAPGGRDRGIGGGTAGAATMARISPRDELDRLADLVMEQSESLRALERVMGRAGRALAALPSRWPVRGAVNSEFGRRQSPWTAAHEFHGGIDIRAKQGTPVQAPARGTVAYAGAQSEYGLTVVLEHGHDIRTIYGHLSKLKVKTGDTVERGAVIGLTGNTGRSSGPHLHYEILVKNRPVNPRAYLWD